MTKVKCKKCGKKEAVLMTKFGVTGYKFENSSIIGKILNTIDILGGNQFYVCGSCGHVEKA